MPGTNSYALLYLGKQYPVLECGSLEVRQSQKSPWKNTRLRHHVALQLDILAPKKMAHLRPSGQFNSPPGRSPSDQACVKAHSHGAPSSVVGLHHSPAGWACYQVGRPFQRPAIGKGVCETASVRGPWGWPYIQTGILTVRGVGNICASVKILCFPEKRRHTKYFHIKWMGMGQCKDSLKTMWRSFRLRTFAVGRTDSPINGRFSGANENPCL